MNSNAMQIPYSKNEIKYYKNDYGQLFSNAQWVMG